MKWSILTSSGSEALYTGFGFLNLLIVSKTGCTLLLDFTSFVANDSVRRVFLLTKESCRLKSNSYSLVCSEKPDIWECRLMFDCYF